MDVVFDFIHFKYQSWTTPVACVDLLFNLRRTQYTYSAIILFQFNKFFLISQTQGSVVPNFLLLAFVL